MFIMSLLCLAGGVLYPKVLVHVITPAVGAALSPAGYIDAMMGKGYAVINGVIPQTVKAPAISIWDPVLWLLLFLTVLCAVAMAVILGDRTRGPVRQASAGEKVPDKYATFFGGEASDHSHAAGSDLFWGFKKDWKGYFRVMTGLHSGKVGDYALWTVMATAFITLFVFIFMS